MSSTKLTYDLLSRKPAHVVNEEHIEYGFIGKLQDLKYEYRTDIRDRAALERNFRDKFEALNRVNLSDGEFKRLLEDIVTPDVFTAARTLRERNAFTRGATTEESSVVQTEGARQVQRPVALYNLDATLAVGYRVRSPRGVQFRRWASTVLKEFLTKGFVMDDERPKNPDGRPDYFDEMLARIRDIRASEKRFYQKGRDLFALSSDYDKTDQATQQFFATVQNRLLYAINNVPNSPEMQNYVKTVLQLYAFLKLPLLRFAGP